MCIINWDNLDTEYRVCTSNDRETEISDNRKSSAFNSNFDPVAANGHMALIMARMR